MKCIFLHKNQPVKNKSFLRQWWYIILFMLVVAGYFGNKYYSDKQRSNHPRYTVGTADRTRSQNKGVAQLEYSYSVNGKYYHKYCEQNAACVMGQSYLVQFEDGNPGNSEMLFDQPVEKGTVAPPKGWEEMP